MSALGLGQRAIIVYVGTYLLLPSAWCYLLAIIDWNRFCNETVVHICTQFDSHFHTKWNERQENKGNETIKKLVGKIFQHEVFYRSSIKKSVFSNICSYFFFQRFLIHHNCYYLFLFSSLLAFLKKLLHYYFKIFLIHYSSFDYLYLAIFPNKLILDPLDSETN